MVELWRVGRHLGRTIYRQIGNEPSDDDELLGMMDTAALGALVVEYANDWFASEVEEEPEMVSTPGYVYVNITSSPKACSLCGAMVIIESLHDRWHGSLA